MGSSHQRARDRDRNIDRASVIIPNSEFITGVVKNWTEPTRWAELREGRRQSYDADPEKVQRDPMGVTSPLPKIVMTTAGTAACFLLGSATAHGVRTALHRRECEEAASRSRASCTSLSSRA